MSNLTKLEFVALDISGNNYLSWILDAELHLDASNLGETIKANNSASLQDRAKALIFLRHHLDESLKNEYLTVKDPLVLWQSLQDLYDHQKTVILPKARYDWLHLRLQDFKSVSEYNSALFQISSQLKLCGENITDEDMLEKTFTTFHASNVLLQQQYRERRFTKYSELIACLLVAEKNNELLLQNHQSRPPWFKAFPEANATFASPHSNRQGHKNGPSRGKGRGRGGGRGRGRGDNSRYRNTGPFKNKKNNSNKGKLPNPQATTDQNIPQRQQVNACYRCGITGHWSRTCRTAKHLVELYQASIKGKGKDIEVNFFYGNGDSGMDLPHFDVSDFFEDPNGNISHLIGDGHVNSD